jgi:dolichol-phosphate mannosyltransferase
MIYLLIPVYNEKPNLNELFENLDKLNLNDSITFIFSDDGSSDGSVALIKELFANKNFVVLGDGKNYGPGAAFNTGFEWILANTTGTNDIVVTLEADNTSDLTILPEMIAISKLGYSLVLASVYAQGGGFDKTTFIRKLMSSIANLIFRFIFDIKVQTLSSFYRVYHIGLLKKIKEKYSKLINETGFICMLEILIKAIEVKARIIEVPMMLNSKKRKGKSKMKIIRTTLSYFRFLFFRKKVK